MKRSSLQLALMSVFLTSRVFAQASAPDTAYLAGYADDAVRGRNGLLFAWSLDQRHWHGIGPDQVFMYCDYGTWGGEKRMHDPFLYEGPDGWWYCVWSVNDRDGALALARSRDLVNWRPQAYPMVNPEGNCLLPEISYDAAAQQYRISWVSKAGDGQAIYRVTTRDFKAYSSRQAMAESERLNIRHGVQVGDRSFSGTVHKVPWSLIRGLLDAQQLAAYHARQDQEAMDEDPVRFPRLRPVRATITVDGKDTRKISKDLIGVFFEDINYAADGGLYAELVQNRGFEYQLSDKKGRDRSWSSLKAWHVDGNGATVRIETERPLHENNPHYAVLTIDQVGAGLVNEGFDGIPVQAGEKYDVSLFARNPEGGSKILLVRVIDREGRLCGEVSIQVASTDWKKYRAVLTSDTTAADAHLELVPQAAGQLALDMISLFPQKTFKGHPNGLRADLAQAIADLHPRFVRFPGGCVAHGDGLSNIYRWKNTIGPLEARKPQRNLWGYHQSAGLGYYEYFQFCEDIGAEPVPIVAAGVPCQNSSTGGAGQQGGIPMSEMDDYVQEVLDLIEWANGDQGTPWGKKRAEAGHPEPFGLTYLGVGNEDLITEIFKERFAMIYRAVKKKHPEITVIGTVGPFFEGSDYEEGWRFAAELGLDVVDEHYYRPPGWFIHNQDYYDKYDRAKARVYLGEYASHVPSRANNIESALSEALYLTAVERNGDVVCMASYAPLLAKEGHTQWNPDLIYFNNTEVMPTVGYYVQQLYGQNSGDTYLWSRLSLSEDRGAVRQRVGVSVVRDSQTRDLILKLVNLLPVDVNARINLESISGIGSAAVKTVLTGNPDDREAVPVTSDMKVGEKFEYTMPKYSFTLIRIKD